MSDYLGNTDELPLFRGMGEASVETHEPTPATTYERFREFHRDNPAVWALFKRYASDALARGSQVGARAIGERIRWHTTVDTVSNDGRKVNDHYWPYYARLLMLTESRFEGFFEQRGGGGDVDDSQLAKECGSVSD